MRGKDQSDEVIDPALRSLPSSPSSDKKQDSIKPMPHRVEQFQMSSPRRQHFDTRPSPPPPITTMSSHSHSPSPSVVSVDRSSNSTPHIRRSPPMPPPPQAYPPSYPQHHDPARHHYNRADHISHAPYIYASHPPFDQPRYDHHQHHPQDPNNRQPYPSPLPVHYPPPHMSHPQQQHIQDYGRQYPMPGQPVAIVHTDDAATKLTDGIRRRCFNCCTTDTSTWRRSNLSPGKVLCNKCGLFERTHSRPRPDQFPHKRGPLATTTLRGRTPPGAQNHLPPISGAGATPYQYHHQPLANVGEYHSGNNTLPGLTNWHNNSSGGSGSSSNNNNGGNANGSNTGGGGAESTHSNGSNNHSGSNSASGTPVLNSRRPTLESPRLSSNSSPHSQRGARSFDQSAESHPHHPPSPPSTISRSTTSSSSQHHESASSSASHTPPPAGSARDPPA